MKTFGFSDSELVELTANLLTAGYSNQAACELIAASTLSIISEPGDQAMGFLAAALGRKRLLANLLSGFEIKPLWLQLQANNSCEEFSELFGNPLDTLRDCRERWLPRLSMQESRSNLFDCQKSGCKVLVAESPDWPKGLVDLRFAQPLILYVFGETKVLSALEDAVSIVGARRATPYGIAIAKKIASSLAQTERVSVSGGALGIDAAAHEGSLESNGQTVAVMAGGLLKSYPPQNHSLFQRIRESGAIISERAMNSPATRWRFLQRNRLIAAVSPSIVVVEAALRSGSIRTANDATMLGRELFAVPGPITAPSSQGCNRLISDGKAVLLEGPEQLVHQQPSAQIQALSELEIRAIDALSTGAKSLAELAFAAGLTQFEAKNSLFRLVDRKLASRLGNHWTLY